jgi:serine/threonine-protein kinase RsbW
VAEPVPPVTVTCPGTAQGLDATHQALADFWLRLHTPPEEMWRVRFELAISEVAANIIEHAKPVTVRLQLGVEPGQAIAEFRDTGLEWHAPPSPNVMVGDLSERGRGLWIARASVDEVCYERAGTINRWRLVKRL